MPIWPITRFASGSHPRPEPSEHQDASQSPWDNTCHFLAQGNWEPGRFFYGGCEWKIFSHVPPAIVAGHAGTGRFEHALAWQDETFAPNSCVRKLHPLAVAKGPLDGLTFDTGDVVTTDPDKIATDYPFYDQQATIRQYLEMLLAAGDAACETQPQEMLQQAKVIHAPAKQSFCDSLSGTPTGLTNQRWPRPGEAAHDGYSNFVPP